MSLCTVDFEMPNFLAALRTVAPVSAIKLPMTIQRSSISHFKSIASQIDKYAAMQKDCIENIMQPLRNVELKIKNMPHMAAQNVLCKICRKNTEKPLTEKNKNDIIHCLTA